MSDLTVRMSTPADATLFADFVATDGYPLNAAQATERLELLANSTFGAVFIAPLEGRMLGWLHIHAVPLLASEGYAEIGGFVVADASRRQGVGRALMQHAIAWTKAETTFSRIRLYSGAHRHAAHAFYREMGFDDSRAPTFTLTILRG